MPSTIATADTPAAQVASLGRAAKVASKALAATSGRQRDQAIATGKVHARALWASSNSAAPNISSVAPARPAPEARLEKSGGARRSNT